MPSPARRLRCPRSARMWWPTTGCAARSAALKLLSAERAERLAAARELAGGADAALLPLVKKALAGEKDAEIRGLLETTAAGMQLRSGTKEERIAAIRLLAASAGAKALLLEVASDSDEDIRQEAQKALRAVGGQV